MNELSQTQAALTLNEDVIYRKMGTQRILVPVGPHIDNVRNIFTLNETAAFIFDGIKENQSFEQLVENLNSEFEFADPNEARSAVSEFISELQQHNILL